MIVKVRFDNLWFLDQLQKLSVLRSKWYANYFGKPLKTISNEKELVAGGKITISDNISHHVS